MNYNILEQYNHLPTNKLKAIELLATKGLEHDLSMQEIADERGVARKTLWSWRSEMAMSREINRSVLPKVLSRLTREVDKASARDITNIARLLFQFHGELTEKTEVTMKDQTTDIDSIIANIEQL